MTVKIVKYCLYEIDPFIILCMHKKYTLTNEIKIKKECN